MKVIDINKGWNKNILTQFKTINGINGFENLTHFLVGDFEKEEIAPFYVVEFGTQSIIMTPDFCRFILDNLDLTPDQNKSLKNYIDALGRLPLNVYTKLFTNLEYHINGITPE